MNENLNMAIEAAVDYWVSKTTFDSEHQSSIGVFCQALRRNIASEFEVRTCKDRIITTSGREFPGSYIDAAMTSVFGHNPKDWPKVEGPLFVEISPSQVVAGSNEMRSNDAKVIWTA